MIKKYFGKVWKELKNFISHAGREILILLVRPKKNLFFYFHLYFFFCGILSGRVFLPSNRLRIGRIKNNEIHNIKIQGMLGRVVTQPKTRIESSYLLKSITSTFPWGTEIRRVVWVDGGSGSRVPPPQTRERVPKPKGVYSTNPRPPRLVKGNGKLFL